MLHHAPNLRNLFIAPVQLVKFMFSSNPARSCNVSNDNRLDSMSYCIAIKRPLCVLVLFVGALHSAPAAEVRHRAASQPAGKLAEDAMRLLHNNCLSCHNAEKHKSGLRLTSRENLLKGGDNGAAATSGKPEKSLIVKVLAPDSDPHMPPKKQLSTNQIQLVRRWIAAGAPWDEAALARAAGPRAVSLGQPPSSWQPALAIALSPDDTRLAIARGNRILIHDVGGTNFNVIAEVTAHKDAVRSLAWSADGKSLASGAFREITLWNAALEPHWTMSSNILERVGAVAFADDKLIACDGPAAQSGWVRVFVAQTGAPVTNWQAHADAIYDLAVSPDAKTLATAGADGLVKLWDIASSKELSRIEAHVGAAFGVAFNSNATEVVTVGADKQLKVWDVSSRESFVTINRKHAFTSVAWSQDGKTVVAGADDGRFFSYSDFKRHSGAQSSETAKERELGDWPEPLNAVTVSTDAKRAFAADYEGKVYVVNSDRKLLATISPSEKTAASNSSPSFVRDVLPAMAKAGCMAGSCHAKPEGQNGFKLSVFSYDPASDYAEIVKEGRGRRVFPAAPEESLLLLKPTMTIDHGGGERFERGSETYDLLVRWIRGGMVYQHTNEPALARIAVEPRERTYRKRSTQPLRVTAHYADGSTRDVTRLAEYVSNDKEMAQVDERGAVRIGALAGQSVIVARYMGFVDAARVTVPADRTLPAKRYVKLPVHNFIDEHAYAHFQKLGFFPSDLCTDAEFLRRSSLDAIGVLPTAEETRAFLANTNANKRTELIERLLAHPAFGDYWANKWADLLRPNPDRVGVKSVYVLDQWLRESFRANKRYDQFARELLTAEGSNHRYGPAVVYRDRREPPELTTIFSQLFLGTRMECARCHHHPNEKWSQDDFYQFAAFFDPVKQKGAGLSPPISAGTETFYFGGGRSAVKHPVTEQVMNPRPPDGPALTIDSKADPRGALADWLINPDNPFFARAAVNRVWANFFGHGIVEPVDDFRSSNPPSNEPLLNALAADFAKNGYDLKHLMRVIMSSRLYQLSSTPNEFNLKDTRNFSRSYRRRLPAEVLLDSVVDVTGVPEDFEGCPPGTRALQTWTYKIDSHFMDAFGRPNPSTDCPCERDVRTSVVQSLHMMNSRALQAKLAHAEGRVKRLAESKLTPNEIVTELYFATFNRPPTNDELNNAASVYEALDATRQTATEDVLWALLNSPEFVFNH
jgi:mono/diheme cytochrome c family protein